MNQRIDLQNSVQNNISVIADDETSDVGAVDGKGWTFINIYSLIELRNIYLAMIKFDFDGDISRFFVYCDRHLPYDNTPWSYRRVEEYLNAFRNFKILSSENHLVKNLFSDQEPNANLTEKDKEVFKNIYYSYFRFKEIHTWFTAIESIDRKQQVNTFRKNDLTEISTELYSFSYNKRFTDAFFKRREKSPEIYILDNSIPLNRRVMRFWDVYVSWGKSLGVLEKVNLEPLDCDYGIKASVSCSYHIQEKKLHNDLDNYVKRKFGFKKIFIPDLVFDLALENRITVDAAKTYVIEQYQKNLEKFSLDNTSEIFIKVSKIDEKESLLYPLYRGQYVSHLTLLQ